MKNFYRIAQGIDVVPAMMSIYRQAELWNQYSLRTQTEGTPHKEVEDIWLRMNDLEKCKQAAARDGFIDHRESINYPAWEKLPHVRQLIMAVMSTVEGQRLGRCFVSKMKPGNQIYPHKDIGDDLSVYYDNEPYYSRYHIVLQGLPGSLFHCGDETVNMRTGEVWWFNGAEEHSVVNNSADDRIHIVVDIKC
jgi:hypothetical protein